MQIKKVIGVIEEFAPLALQESYDNAGLLVGEGDAETQSALLCLDVTEEVLDEAISIGAQLIISHHPLIFKGIKKLTGSGPVERIIIKALRNNISIYACHTNIDRVWGGVNSRISEKLKLRDPEVLSPGEGILRKLVVFVPVSNAAEVRDALFQSGAGHIGEYDRCSFNLGGEGSFRGTDKSNPFAGQAGNMHFENEIRIETVYPAYLEKGIIKNMIDTHPYEEVAYDIYPLENKWNRAGIGIVGNLEIPVDSNEFLDLLKSVFDSKVIRHTRPGNRKINRVAVCGGSGSYLVSLARERGADAYVSADFKYHDFFDGDDRMMIADIGHFESEQFTLEIFHELLTKKFPNFAVHFSDINTNPIYYFK